MSLFDTDNVLVYLFKYIQNKEKYLRDFKNGNLFFSPLEDFVKLEKIQHNSKTGDEGEGSVIQNISSSDKNLKLSIDNKLVKPEDIKGISIYSHVSEDTKKNNGICSFFAVFSKDLISTQHNKLSIKSKVVKDLLKTKDGDRTLFYLDSEGTENFLKECHAKRLIFNKIHYFDPDKPEALNNYENFELFYKNKKYSFQHEFRIVKDIYNGNQMIHFSSLKRHIHIVKLREKN